MRQSLLVISNHLASSPKSRFLLGLQATEREDPPVGCRRAGHMGALAMLLAFLFFCFLWQNSPSPLPPVQCRVANESSCPQGRNSKDQSEKRTEWGSNEEKEEDKRTPGSSDLHRSWRQNQTGGQMAWRQPRAKRRCPPHPTPPQALKRLLHFCRDAQILNTPRNISTYFPLDFWWSLFWFLLYIHSCFWILPEMKLILEFLIFISLLRSYWESRVWLFWNLVSNHYKRIMVQILPLVPFFWGRTSKKQNILNTASEYRISEYILKTDFKNT